MSYAHKERETRQTLVIRFAGAKIPSATQARPATRLGAENTRLASTGAPWMRLNAERGIY